MAGLRGCIGTVEPARPNVAEEIVENANPSGDPAIPRFPSVSPTELPHLEIQCRHTVAARTPPADSRDLDHLVYGVIVETLDGVRRGLLLPRIEGIESVEEQWQAVHSKAGITPGTQVRVGAILSVTRFRRTLILFLEFGTCSQYRLTLSSLTSILLAEIG